MKFRKINDNTNWITYRNIVNHNTEYMGRLPIPIFLQKSYAKLISFYPLNDRMEKTYQTLNKNKKVAFLFKYLIKVSKNNGLSKSLIDKLIRLKNDYDIEYKSKMSYVEKKDKLKMYLLSKDYDSILNLHLKDKVISDKFNDLSQYTKLIIDVLIDNDFKTIKKNQKKWNIENRGYFQTERIISQPVFRKKQSILSLKNNMGEIFDDVMEWDDFINNEIEKRINKKMKYDDNNKKSNSLYTVKSL